MAGKASGSGRGLPPVYSTSGYGLQGRRHLRSSSYRTLAVDCSRTHATLGKTARVEQFTVGYYKTDRSLGMDNLGNI